MHPLRPWYDARCDSQEVFDALRHYQPRPAPAPEEPIAVTARAADSEEVFAAAELPNAAEVRSTVPVAGSSSMTLVVKICEESAQTW